ncbi:hypothetical protein BD289DRAFT_12562 [Coniella lustricola]|uniref:Uncharacterized protein n=1 Tax=Coniella lustricola TaxID=2025994 RepID=A0A2T3A4A4_9PEZI|nr:hypothetical protein BD289DRAFT_12562 [Coniella lustricola]
MAPPKRAKGAPTKRSPSHPSKEEVQSDAKKRNTLRRRQIKKAKRAKQLRAFKAAIRTADDPATKKELLSIEGQIYQPWKFGPRASAKLSRLEALIKQQDSEIKQLRTSLKEKSVPELTTGGPEIADALGEQPDSSPVKIVEQLLNDATVAQEASAIGHAAIPSVEVEDLEQSVEQRSSSSKQASPGPNDEQTAVRDTPSITSKKIARGLSVESDATTPRTLRRSPRKRVERQI